MNDHLSETLVFFIVGAVAALMFLWIGYEAASMTFIVYIAVKVTTKSK